MKEYEILQLNQARDGAILKLSFKDRADEGKVESASFKNGSIRIKKWGADNDLPQYREKTLMDNNIVGELIQKKAEFNVGLGLHAYKVIDDDGKVKKVPQQIPTVIADWIEKNDFNDKLLSCSRDGEMHANMLMEYQAKASGEIVNVKAHKIRNIRLAEKNKKGVIDKAYYSSDWDGEDLRKNRQYQTLALYEEGIKGNFALHIKNDLFDDGYYGHPAYWGGKEWIELSNTIPKFHKANLENGYVIRYHIKIPKGYFLDKEKYEGSTDPEEKANCLTEAKDLRKKFMDKVNKFLAGVKNTGRALFTAYDFDHSLGKEYPGIKIESIDTDLKDESLLKLFEKSNQANISGQGLPTVLAGIETQGKLSSGSEMLNAFNYYNSVNTISPRRRLLKFWKIILERNGWKKKYPDLQWGLESVELKKMADDKTGVQPNVEG